MGLGHAWGLVKTRSLPEWKNGAWVYRGGDAHPVSLGNVITGSTKSLARTLSNPHVSVAEGKTVLDHEMAHIPQSQDLGVSYVPAVLLSYGIGGAWAWATGGDFMSGTHEYSIFENGSGYNDAPDY